MGFLLYSFRFQGQTDLHKSKPSDFRMAIEEALLAEQGFMDGHLGTPTTLYDGFHEASGPNQFQECASQCQVCFLSTLIAHFIKFFSLKITLIDVVGCEEI